MARWFLAFAIIAVFFGAAHTNSKRPEREAEKAEYAAKDAAEELAREEKYRQEEQERGRIAALSNRNSYEYSGLGYKDEVNKPAQVKEVYEVNPELDYRSLLTISKFEWRKGGFKSVMIANFHFKNTGKRTAKDIKILCTGYGNSGTVIDNNIVTVYELVKPGKTKKVEVNVGFIRSQVASASCSIVDFDQV